MVTVTEKTGLVEREDEMSDTPRTDNAASEGTTVPADFAADLERELNAMIAERDAGNAALANVARLMDSVSKAEAEVEKLRADAERYRWLRDMDEDPVVSLAAQYTDCLGSAISISMRIDAAIDAALKETK
jgi:hypothetical protein